MRPVRAVAFDFNGTLSDDEPILLSVYQELFAERGRPLTKAEYFDSAGDVSAAARGVIAPRVVVLRLVDPALLDPQVRDQQPVRKSRRDLASGCGASSGMKWPHGRVLEWRS